jgi:hypothetical protein
MAKEVIDMTRILNLVSVFPESQEGILYRAFYQEVIHDKTFAIGIQSVEVSIIDFAKSNLHSFLKEGIGFHFFCSVQMDGHITGGLLSELKRAIRIKASSVLKNGAVIQDF